MDWVHEGVHGPGPQGWSLDRGSMFCIRPAKYGDIPNRSVAGVFKVRISLLWRQSQLKVD